MRAKIKYKENYNRMRNVEVVFAISCKIYLIYEKDIYFIHAIMFSIRSHEIQTQFLLEYNIIYVLLESEVMIQTFQYPNIPSSSNRNLEKY